LGSPFEGWKKGKEQEKGMFQKLLYILVGMEGWKDGRMEAHASTLPFRRVED